MNLTRRHFARKVSLTAGAIAALVGRAGATPATLDSALARVQGVTPEALARDEDFWFHVQQAFSIDRSFINLNYGAVHPSPRVVQDAIRRYMDFANGLPAMNEWHYLRPRRELVRKQVADTFGCDLEEIALLRNTTEAMNNVLLGVDLKPGDELLTTTNDFVAMRQTLLQRQVREGVTVRTLPFPYPPDDVGQLADLFRRHVTARTKLILTTHVTNLTGQIFPVRDICRLGLEQGIPVAVDGAHAFGHLSFRQADLGCEFYGTNLHKWIMAPIGTGFLYVNRLRIGKLWPLFPPQDPERRDIRKLEELGTTPEYLRFAVSEALSFHHGIGVERKEARLRYLKDSWATRVRELPGVRLLTSLDPQQSCGIATFTVAGMDMMALCRVLGERHQILVLPVELPAEREGGASFGGIRVTPSICTTLGELEAFVETVSHYVRAGLPSRGAPARDGGVGTLKG